MAEVIRFPNKYREFGDLDGDTRQRCMLALRFVFDNIRSGKVDPTEMFLMYGTRDGAETIWSYLNLGFDPKGLTKAMCRVLDDVEERDEDRGDDPEW